MAAAPSLRGAAATAAGAPAVKGRPCACPAPLSLFLWDNTAFDLGRSKDLWLFGVDLTLRF
jgi:hypothetical protein